MLAQSCLGIDTYTSSVSSTTQAARRPELSVRAVPDARSSASKEDTRLLISCGRVRFRARSLQIWTAPPEIAGRPHRPECRTRVSSPLRVSSAKLRRTVTTAAEAIEPAHAGIVLQIALRSLALSGAYKMGGG